ncbi:MAG: autotransporter domain-containing protein [Planctomycetia bacterium]|nr:autotransporter domain-containing protein [Planctomycetia bacterium]
MPLVAKEYNNIGSLDDLNNALNEIQSLPDTAHSITLTASFDLGDDFDFSIPEGITVTLNTGDFQLTVTDADHTSPKKTGNGTLIFSCEKNDSLAFPSFSSVEGTVQLKDETAKVTREILAGSDITTVGDAGTLNIQENGTVWNTEGNINVGKIAGTSGEIKVTGTVPENEEEETVTPHLEAGTISLGESGTGTMTINAGTATADKLELGKGESGTGNLTILNSGSYDSTGVINGGMVVTTLETGAGKANISLSAASLNVINAFTWNTETTTIEVQDASFLNFHNGLTVSFEENSRQTGISLSDVSYFWVGKQSSLGVVEISADANFSTSVASTLSMTGGSVLYSTGDFNLTANTDGSFTVDVSGIDEGSNSSSCFFSHGSINITGAGGTFVTVTDGGTFNAQNELKWDMIGSNSDIPELTLSGSGASLSAGTANFTTTGNSYINIMQSAGFKVVGYTDSENNEISGDATFTAEAGGGFHFDISGTYNSFNSYFYADGNVTMNGDGQSFIKLTDGGIMEIEEEFTMDMKGTNGDQDSEIYIDGVESGLSVGSAQLATTGASTIHLSGGGGFYSAGDATLTTDGQNASFSINLSGGTATNFSFFEVGMTSSEDSSTSGNLLITGTGSSIIRITDYGYLLVHGDMTIQGVNSSISLEGINAQTVVKGHLSLGSSGVSQVDIQNGANITTGSATLGATQNGSVVVNISGTGTGTDTEGNAQTVNTSWVNTGEIKVGDEADAEVNISEGGYLQAGTLNVANKDNSSETGSVINLSGTSEENYSYLEFTDVIIGNAGKGSLKIDGFGSAYGQNVTVGSQGTGQGDISLSGEGALLRASGDMIIGDSGEGEIVLSEGTYTSAATLQLGNTATGEGVLKITGGAMDIYTVDDEENAVGGNVIIGVAGSGDVYLAAELDPNTKEIVNLGEVNTGAVQIGLNADSIGKLTITDKASWTSGVTQVGVNGTGTLEITDGGSLTTAGLLAASGENGNASILVQGDGSSLNITAYGSELSMGTGTGTLTVSEGATMNIASGGLFSMNGDATFTDATLNLETTFVDASTTTWSYFWLNDGCDLTMTDSSVLAGNGLIWLRSTDDENTVFGDLVLKNGAAVSPGGTESGSEIGYIYVDGNLKIQDGIYNLDLAQGTNNSDLIEVSGTVHFDGGINVNVLDSISENDTWTIISSTGNITAQNVQISGNIPKFVDLTSTVSAGETSNRLILGVERNTFFQNTAKNINSQAVGKLLDSFPLDQWYGELDKISQGTENQIDYMLNQMSGSIRANAMQLARQQLWVPLGDRISWNPEGKIYMGAQNPYTALVGNRSAVWMTPNYHRFTVDSSKGLDSYKMDAFNILVGLDTIFEDEFAGGIFAGFGSPTLKQGYDEASAENFTIGLHAAYRFIGGFELRGMVAYSYHTFYIDRNLHFVTGDSYHAHTKYGGSSLTANVELTRPLFLPLAVIRPMLALDMEYVWMESTVEEGAGLYNLSYNKSNSAWTFLRAGMNFDLSPWDRLSFRGRLFYALQLDDPETDMTASFAMTNGSMTIYGTDPGRYYFNVGLTANLMLGQQRRVGIFANYDAYLGSRSDSHLIGGGFQILY